MANVSFGKSQRIHTGTIRNTLRGMGIHVNSRMLYDNVIRDPISGRIDPRSAQMFASFVTASLRLDIHPSIIVDALKPFTMQESLSPEALIDILGRKQRSLGTLRSAARDNARDLKHKDIRQQILHSGTDIDSIVNLLGDSVGKLGVRGVGIYLLDKESGRLMSKGRHELADASRYETPHPPTPGEKRFFIASGQDYMCFDRLSIPEEIPQEDREAVEKDFSRDQIRYFPDYATTPEIKDAVRENVYFRIRTSSRYDVILHVNNHSYNSQSVKRGNRNIIFLKNSARAQAIAFSVGNIGVAVARAIDNAEAKLVNESLARRLALLHELRSSIDQVSMLTDLPQLYTAVLNNLDSQFSMAGNPPIGRASIMLLDEKPNILEVHAHRGFSDAQAKRIKLSPGQGIAGEVFIKGKGLLVEDAGSSERLIGRGGKVDEGSFMCAPIISSLPERKILGVLSVRSIHMGAFKEEELAHLEDIGKVLGDAITRVGFFAKKDIDGLTGFYVRRAGLERAEAVFALSQEPIIEARTVRSLSVLFYDADNFKWVNDGPNGHKGGDAVLSNISRDIVIPYLKELKVYRSIPGFDYILIRYGGEEFVPILVNVSPEQAERIAEEIRKRAEAYKHTMEGENMRRFADKDDLLYVTLSVGVAHLSPESRTIYDLIEQADVAMYWSKKNGRNRVTMHNPSMTKNGN